METIIVLLTLITRLPFLSRWLEDWDSVQFAMAMHNYNIGENLPHAPGYPIYILIGKIFLFFTGNNTLALTLMSTVFASLTILLIYLLTKEMFEKTSGVLAALIAIFIPIHLLMSISALTNIPGLFALLLFAYFLYKGRGNNIKSMSFLGGLILGIRFTEIPIILSLLILTILYFKKIRETHFYILSFSVGVLTWVLPMIFVTGISQFTESYKWITNYVISHDSIGGSAFSSLGYRLRRIKELLAFGYTKLFTILSLFGILIHITKRDYKYLFLSVWFLSYFCSLVFFYNLELTRYTLPLLPPMVIVVAHILIKIKNNSTPFFYTIGTLLFLVLIKNSISQIYVFKTTVPPSVAPIKYLIENYSPENTIVIGSYIYRQFQYYAPNYRSFYTDSPTIKDLENIDYVVIDYLGLINKLPKNIKYAVLENKEFTGDSTIYTRISRVTLTVLKIKK